MSESCAGLLAEYVNEVKLAMDLDVIVKCRMSGDYSLGVSAEGGAARKFKKAWRIYRYLPACALSCEQASSESTASSSLLQRLGALSGSWKEPLTRDPHCAIPTEHLQLLQEA